MDTFRLIDGQRVHFRDGVRVHGFVTNGGQAVNIIPEFAACEISVRARDVNELARVKGIVERCARGAAMASGVEVNVQVREGYKDMINNMTFSLGARMHRRIGCPYPQRRSPAAKPRPTCSTTSSMVRRAQLPTRRNGRLRNTAS